MTYKIFIAEDEVMEVAPHLVLLDIKLPEQNGFSICSQIRSLSQVPIVFVTSCGTDIDELNIFPDSTFHLLFYSHMGAF